jgi:hypothetical protein
MLFPKKTSVQRYKYNTFNKNKNITTNIIVVSLTFSHLLENGKERQTIIYEPPVKEEDKTYHY